MEAEQKKPHAQAGGGKSFVARELNGATFLTLEHVAHMILVVAVPLLVLCGVMSALSMWTGSTGITAALSPMLAGASAKAVEAVLALGVVATLVVLVPLLVVLDRRTRAEWGKRPGYAGRLAYKVPVYSALALVGAAMVAVKIQLLYVILASLAFIGVPNAPIGDMYMASFLPSLALYVVLLGTAWYLFKLAKGQDNGRAYSLGMAALSAIVTVALFATTVTVLHGNDSSFTTPQSSPTPSSTYDSDYYQNMLDEYYR